MTNDFQQRKPRRTFNLNRVVFNFRTGEIPQRVDRAEGGLLAGVVEEQIDIDQLGGALAVVVCCCDNGGGRRQAAGGGTVLALSLLSTNDCHRRSGLPRKLNSM